MRPDSSRSSSIIRIAPMVPTLFVALVAIFFLAACAARAQSGGDPVASGGGVVLTRAFPGLSFERPVDFQYPPERADLLFVVEQEGRILVFDRTRPQEGTSLFLDITSRVDSGGNEEGLLGLAFHPDFADNGSFYLNYTASNPDRTVIARYTVRDAPTRAGSDELPRADRQSGKAILEFRQPYSNHNGGQIAFGPDDYLYIATGDGGAGGDPQGNGQDPGTLLGAILRIDVDGGGTGRAYGIPPDNPFAGNTRGYREEVFAYGLRNPWRFSFDSANGTLWAGDVGQNAYEEIDVIEPGGNYGWNIMEGRHCYSPRTGCDRTGLILPVAEYGHDSGRSVTGGFVYRGSDVPPLRGRYVYADYVSGRVWTLAAENPREAEPELLFNSDLRISSFGLDRNGELYLLAFDGGIYRFQAE